MKRHYKTPKSKVSQAGFTIVELMIATTVFSMVLLVIIYGVISFTRAYYSGINSSSTQNTARNVVNTVAQAIEFSGNLVTQSGSVGGGNPAYYFCVGGTTYFYIPGVKFNSTQAVSGTNPGLFAEPGSCNPSPNFSDPKGQELLGNAMRVTFMSVQSVPGSSRLYKVSIGLAYGDADLLCNHSISSGKGSCTAGQPTYTLGPPEDSVVGTDANDVVCKLAAGEQYCAHAGLTTTVSLRVASSELQP